MLSFYVFLIISSVTWRGIRKVILPCFFMSDLTWWEIKKILSSVYSSCNFWFGEKSEKSFLTPNNLNVITDLMGSSKIPSYPVLLSYQILFSGKSDEYFLTLPTLLVKSDICGKLGLPCLTMLSLNVKCWLVGSQINPYLLCIHLSQIFFDWKSDKSFLTVLYLHVK